MTENTSSTLTDAGTQQHELHTEDLVAPRRADPASDVDAASTAADPDRSASPTSATTAAPTTATTATSSGTPTTAAPEAASTPLVEDVDGYRRRWEAVQTGFVDEPRRAVENADALVAEVITELASSFAQERDDLEGQWSKGDQVSTEDLRVSLRRYRSFFDRLLSA